MVQVGQYNTLKVSRKAEFGVYLDDGAEGILLPKRFVPRGLQVGDELEVFVYHDSENRLIATTEKPFGIVGDIVRLKCVSTMSAGAFLDWGLMKDLFVAKSQQLVGMKVGGTYLVKIYIDEQTGRVAATEKVSARLSNENLTVEEKQVVDLLVYRRTDLGYVMIINNQHTGLLHDSDVFQNIEVGDKVQGYIKTIRPDNKIDVALGKPGYQKVGGEAEKILLLLQEHNGYLPYNDKSEPEDIYSFFGMSKKTFKMAVGNLYKQQLIEMVQGGIVLKEQA